MITYSSPRGDELRFVTVDSSDQSSTPSCGRSDVTRRGSFRSGWRDKARKERIVRASADQIKGMRARGESRSDWNAAAALTADDIERLTLEDEGAAPAGWESTVEIGIPTTKQAVHLRLDRDVLGWFRSYGPGYQTRINAVLRAFMSARQHAERAEHKPR